MGGHQPQGSVPYSSTSGTGGHQPQGSVPYSSTSGTGGHQLQGSVPYSITSGTGGHQLQGSVPYSITSGTGGHQLRYNLGHITTIAALRAKESPLGNHFRTTVRPKDLPECWGIKYTCDIDLDSMHQERVVESWNPVDFCREEDMLPCREEDMLLCQALIKRTSKHGISIIISSQY